MQASKAGMLFDQITKAGQRFYDKPVLAEPKPDTIIGQSVAAAFGRRAKKRLLIGYERVNLRWLKPKDILERKRNQGS